MMITNNQYCFLVTGLNLALLSTKEPTPLHRCHRIQLNVVKDGFTCTFFYNENIRFKFSLDAEKIRNLLNQPFCGLTLNGENFDCFIKHVLDLIKESKKYIDQEELTPSTSVYKNILYLWNNDEYFQSAMKQYGVIDILPKLKKNTLQFFLLENNKFNFSTICDLAEGRKKTLDARCLSADLIRHKKFANAIDFLFSAHDKNFRLFLKPYKIEHIEIKPLSNSGNCCLKFFYNSNYSPKNTFKNLDDIPSYAFERAVKISKKISNTPESSYTEPNTPENFYTDLIVSEENYRTIKSLLETDKLFQNFVKYCSIGDISDKKIPNTGEFCIRFFYSAANCSFLDLGPLLSYADERKKALLNLKSTSDL